VSVCVCLESESQIIQPVAVVFGQGVTERIVLYDYFHNPWRLVRIRVNNHHDALF